MNQLIQGLAGAALTSFVGKWLDKHDRHFGAQLAIAVSNLTMMLTTSLLSACLHLEITSRLAYSTLLGLALTFSAASTTAFRGKKIIFTSDWVVVLVSHNGKAVLSGQNAALVTIDQISTIISPVIAGTLIVRVGILAASVIFVLGNVLTWSAQAFSMRAINRNVHTIATRIQKEKRDKEAGKCIQLGLARTYYHQEAFPVAIGMAALFLTVLNFGGITMSYGKTQGLPEDILGLFRSVGAVFGMSAALFYTLIERRFGVIIVGFCGLTFELVCLLLCVASIWLPGSPFDPASYFQETTLNTWLEHFLHSFDPVASPAHKNVTVAKHQEALKWSTLTIGENSAVSLLSLFVGIALGKFGIRMFDLSVNQIMQETVAEADRGTVFGVQNSLVMVFSVARDLLTIGLPDPRTFGILVLVSIAMILFAFFPYTYYAVRRRIKLDSINA